MFFRYNVVISIQGDLIMTIGERIRYFRKRLGITQEDLARRADLHPVSIRKYETNKMVPQYDQIEKLATALEVNVSALGGINYSRFKLRTIGDLMGLLIALCDSEILKLEGDRDEAGMIVPHTAFFSVNPKVSQFFFVDLAVDNSLQIPLNHLSARIGNARILVDFLSWEKERYLYRYYNYRLMNRFSKEDAELLLQAEARKEAAELELQQSTELLPWPNGVVGDLFVP